METNIQEIWKDIPGYEESYQASTIGRIRSKDRLSTTGDRRLKGRIISGGLYPNGYALVVLTLQDGRTVTTSKHRLVALTFISNPDNKRCVNHKNSIRTDNRVENLEWVTHKENTKHGMDVGRIKLSGSNATQSILNEIDVIGIRSRPNINIKRCAHEFGVSESTIRAVLNRRNWRHI